MPILGFEPTIPGFQRAKAVHALETAATVTVLRVIRDPYKGFTSRSGFLLSAP
jgi:hypothetical protein